MILIGVVLGLVVGIAPSSDASAFGPNTVDHGHPHGQNGSTSTTTSSDPQRDLDEISTELLEAQARLDTAARELVEQQRRLARLRDEVRSTERAEVRLRDRLRQAVVRLNNARSDIVHGRADVKTSRSELTGYALSSYQTGGIDVYALGLALSSGTTRQAVDGMQDVNAILTQQAGELQRFQAAQALLRLTEQRIETTRNAVAHQRRLASDNLARYRILEDRAVVTRRAISAQVADLQADQERLAQAKAAELRRLVRLQLPTTEFSNHGYLSYPIANAYVTSPYGMRMHPILHVWKLHDGTDFSAECGTPVYAAAAGTITEEYFNIGYGNRVMMDNGHVKGVDLATSYNHLTSFVARIGQHVARGQLIAYSGTTGYSTGCHLHFMVYVDGATVDPMTWL